MIDDSASAIMLLWKKFEFDYYDWAEFEQFLDQLPDKDAAKLIATIQNIENNGLLVAERQLWVKKLENNLYEIRSKRSSNIQRALYFQVKGSQYIITNAFTKKTQKTPENEKKIARNRRSQYLNKEENQ
ncbi:addiction module toxin RelE [Leuconostoc mesenteroides subsp. cremoris TIFN8]|nr:addiction module toxin RelE [Leuconostoc mesenteroides subsp. cremoris TIFN8]EQC53410.1 addiction module toxin RelE [Leuconostoc mesenteroides subsp. cremoris TIFN8]